MRPLPPNNSVQWRFGSSALVLVLEPAESSRRSNNILRKEPCRPGQASPSHHAGTTSRVLAALSLAWRRMNAFMRGAISAL